VHYYQFNIGDYASHTSHLDPLEDIAYRRMIDYCYLHESGLPSDIEEISKKIRMREQCKCIEYVLQEFFLLKDNAYTCKRIDEEIKNYKSLSNKRKKAANKRWANDTNGLDGDAKGMQVHSTSNANHKPLTTNHKPITKGKDIEKKSDDINTKYSFDFPEWVDNDAMSEWLLLRKKNKASNSQRALKVLIKHLQEIKDAGIDPTIAIDTAITKGWKTVELSYLQNMGIKAGKSVQKDKDYTKGSEGFIQ